MEGLYRTLDLSPVLFQNFQFEFHEYPEILFDKVIELKVSSEVSGGRVKDPLIPHHITPDRCATGGLWPSF